MKNLDNDIIKYSVGIGLSFTEAEKALNIAKERDKNSLINIVEYEGERLKDFKEIENSNVFNYKEVYDFLIEKDANDNLLEFYETLLRDSKTGLLNKLGFEYFLFKLKEDGIDNGIFILFDGNHMKEHNSEKGFKEVDRYLEATGRAINHSTRNNLERRIVNGRGSIKRRKINYKDVISHRVNDSGGDEFLVYIPDGVDDIDPVKIAERVLNNIYDEERGIVKSY